MRGPALVEQQALGQQRAEHAAGELGEHVDHRVDRGDPFDRRRRQRHGGVEMAAADHAEHDDQAEQQEGVDEADDGEVRAELGLVAGRHEQNDDAGR